MLQDVLEAVSRIKSLPVELVEVARKFVVKGADHTLQLSLHLTPQSFDSIRMGSRIRVDKVFGVVDHQVDVAEGVQVKIGC